jgi:uncharacterized protein
MSIKVFASIFFYSFYLLFPVLFFLIWKLFWGRRGRIEIIILILITLLLIWARFIEPKIVVIKKYDFISKNHQNRELKVAIFSDFHLGTYNNEKIMKKAVNKINESQVDLVLMPGDFLYLAKRENISKKLSPLKEIRIPKIAILGNHDYGSGEKDVSKELTNILESLDVSMIDNKVKRVEIKGQEIDLIGLTDLWTGNPDYSTLKRKEHQKEADFSFLLSHNPDIIYEINKTEKNIQKIDLMIAGHTHGGQIRLPFIYKHLIPTMHDFDKGFYNIFNTDIFVTPGIGSVILPMRLFNFPEISIINIKY